LQQFCAVLASVDGIFSFVQSGQKNESTWCKEGDGTQGKDDRVR